MGEMELETLAGLGAQRLGFRIISRERRNHQRVLSVGGCDAIFPSSVQNYSTNIFYINTFFKSKFI